MCDRISLRFGMENDHRLRFHVRCGTLVKLSPNSRSAKRLRAYDEFNNGVVMTNRHVYDDELFEVNLLLFIYHYGSLKGYHRTMLNVLSNVLS